MQYWMLQVFLSPREKPPIIDAVAPSRITRQQYLLKTFGEEVSFQYRKRRYVYRFYENTSGVIAAVIGRAHTTTITPKEDFQSQEITDWETANVFIDTSGDATGQRVAMQKTSHIATPLEVFRGLTDFINRRDPDTDWTISVNPVSKSNEFWSAVDQYQGKITELDLVYIPPNIWGAQSETEKALKSLQAKTNTDEVDVKLKNADGKLELKNETIEQSVDYVTKGGGKAVLKVGRRKVFDTDSAVVIESPEEDVEVQQAPEESLLKLIARLFNK